MKKLWVFLVAGVTVGAVFASPAAAAPVGFDPFYGSGGLVQLTPPLPPGLFPIEYSRVKGVFARSGSAYVVETASTCDSSYSSPTCAERTLLFRYGKSGALDSGFGGSGSVDVSGANAGLSVDAKGRAVLAGWTEGGALLKRVLANGRPDKSFGHNGTVPLPQLDYPWFLLSAGRGRILVGSVGDPVDAGGSRADEVTLARLMPNGSLDRSFGHGGRVSYVLGVKPLETPVVVDRRGSILILGGLCCEGLRPVYRISATGKLDTRFNAAARAALNRLAAFGPTEPTALVARADGGVDVLGEIGNMLLNPRAGTGFELRLQADGKLDTGFGNRGVQKLPLPVAAAGPGLHGGTFALAQVEETATALRLLADGEPDPAFGGGQGVPVPQQGHGATVQPLAGGRAGLFGNGYRSCNQATCISAPYLARFIEASPSRSAGKKGGGS